MQAKQATYIIKGMQRDASVSKFNPDFAYENYNIRITTRNKENTLLTVVNERGNTQLNITGIDNNIILGKFVGKLVLNNIILIFTQDTVSRIYRLIYDIITTTFTGSLIYDGNAKGDLGFSTSHPIETLGIYENEDIQKCYWVDGINQPRVINFAPSVDISKFTNHSFDFVQQLTLEETVDVIRNDISNGTFSPGSIQYAFTYYHKYGQESNIFYTSPLLQTSFTNRGGSADTNVSNSFDITIKSPDTTFDYIRVYSILRTSIDATPKVLNVVDLVVPSDGSAVNYTDTGTNGSTVDPTLLLYIGGEEIIAGTLVQKDNTLFLGNIQLKRRLIDSTIKTALKNKSISFVERDISKNTSYPHTPEYGGYTYDNSLKYPSNSIRTFKTREWYRFGIIAQHISGKWSEVIPIGDYQNGIAPTYVESDINDAHYNLTSAQLVLDSTTDKDLIKNLTDAGYVKIKGVVVYPTINDRDILCQGILCPTVYNVEDRYSNAPFVCSSWFTRPNLPYDLSLNYLNWAYTDMLNCPGAIVTNEETIFNTGTISSPVWTAIENVNKGAWVEFRHNKPIPSNGLRNAEIQCITNPPSHPYYDPNTVSTTRKVYNVYENKHNLAAFCIRVYLISTTGNKRLMVNNDPFVNYTDFKNNLSNRGFHNPTDEATLRANQNVEYELGSFEVPSTQGAYNANAILNDYLQYNKECFFVDQSILTMHSPEIEFDDSIQNMDSSNLKMRIVGKINIGATLTDQELSISTAQNAPSTTPEPGIYKELINNPTRSLFGFRGLVSAPNYFDSGVSIGETVAWVTYPWHRNGSLMDSGIPSSTTVRPAMLSKNLRSNLRISYLTDFYDTPWNAYRENDKLHTGITDVSIFNSDEETMLKIPAPANSDLSNLTYYGNVNKILMPSRLGDKKDGYSIMRTLRSSMVSAGTSVGANHSMFSASYTNADTTRGTDPISMKYKSTPHAVFAMNYTELGRQVILPCMLVKSGYSFQPTLNAVENPLIYSVNNDPSFINPFWEKNQIFNTGTFALNIVYFQTNQPDYVLNATWYNPNTDIIYIGTGGSYVPNLMQEHAGAICNYTNYYNQLHYYKITKTPTTSDYTVGLVNVDMIYQDTITDNAQYGFLWLAELYRDDITNRFGGNTEEAYEINKWVSCGEAIDLRGDIYTCLAFSYLVFQSSTGVIIRVPFVSTQVALEGSIAYSEDGNTSLGIVTITTFNSITDCTISIGGTSYSNTNLPISSKYDLEELWIRDINTAKVGDEVYTISYDHSHYGILTSSTYGENTIINTSNGTIYTIDQALSQGIISIVALSSSVPGIHIITQSNGQYNVAISGGTTMQNASIYTKYKDVLDTIWITIVGDSSVQYKWFDVRLSKSNLTVEYTEGDTYIQRYDCLKTYPYTSEDQNSVTDIISFVCETRINIDGRYDRNRGQNNNLSMTPSNFNLLNKVYSQQNNFFTYNTVNPNKLNLNNFPNTITWTKTKTLGELTDTWSNITVASTLDVDGDKGPINAIRRFNNELYCFQDRGISRILYNLRTQIPTSDGIAIELANSGKVDGKVYLTQNIGCLNKWSIISVPSGMYFIDNLTSGIFIFDGKSFTNISDRLGFRTFVAENNSNLTWNGVDASNFISFYDSANSDIYFVNNKYCLCYSELLGQFVSFYSYEKVPMMFSDAGSFFCIKDLNEDGNITLWQNEVGDYNSFFGKTQPFYVTIIANPDEPKDKVFSTLDFKAESWQDDVYKDKITFNSLEVWNEYQFGSSILSNSVGRPSPLKKKFRIWRANIPRDKSNNRDRIRSPWAYLKLSNYNPSNTKTELHDMTLHYYL